MPLRSGASVAGAEIVTESDRHPAIVAALVPLRVSIARFSNLQGDKPDECSAGTGFARCVRCADRHGDGKNEKKSCCVRADD